MTKQEAASAIRDAVEEYVSELADAFRFDATVNVTVNPVGYGVDLVFAVRLTPRA